jgi:hypothetical protein
LQKLAYAMSKQANVQKGEKMENFMGYKQRYITGAISIFLGVIHLLPILFNLHGKTVDAALAQSFSQDQCQLPCWMGLIPGVSTTADVEQFIVQTPSLSSYEVFGRSNPDTDLVSEGLYELLMSSATTTVLVQIRIREGIIYLIRVNSSINNDPWEATPIPPEDYLTLEEVLQTFGTPDYVYFYPAYYRAGDSVTYTLIYAESRMRVKLTVRGAHASCDLTTIQDDLVTDFITYYSTDAASELVSVVGSDQPQPVLTAYGLGERNVPLDIWENILDGNVNDACGRVAQSVSMTTNTPSTVTITNSETPQSLFVDDTCSPPCWFGLVTGESTSEEVDIFMTATSHIFRSWEATSDSVFDPQTGDMRDGKIHFDWVVFENDSARLRGNSINLTDGILVSINTSMNRVLLLREVLETLGYPDYITMDSGIDTSRESLSLTYFDLRLNVNLDSLGCSLSQIGNAFWVDWISYYAPMSDDEATAIADRRGRHVSLELWQAWLNGEVAQSCFQAWESLSD